MSFAQSFVLSNILGGGGGGDTEDGTVATEALSRITDESVGTATTSRSHVQAEVVREEMAYDVTRPPPVPIPADLAGAVRSTGTDNDSDGIGVSVSGGTLSEIESDASTSASTSVTSSANENTTISSMSMDDLSSITTSTSLDELSTAVIEMGSDAIGTTSTHTFERVRYTDGGPGENEGQRWNRIGWPVLRSRNNMALSDARSQEEDDGGGQTIVSSPHTDVDSPPDAPSADMLSFQPSMIDSSLDAPSSLRSPSEASTSLDSLSEASLSSDTAPAPAPAPPPPSQEAESPKAQSSPWPSQATGHDPTAFAAVGSSLLFPSRESGTDNEARRLVERSFRKGLGANGICCEGCTGFA